MKTTSRASTPQQRAAAGGILVGGRRAPAAPYARQLLARGNELIAVLRERAPERAGARMQHLYEDTRAVLGAPFVHPFFGVLAHYPSWLDAAWRDVRGIAASPAFDAAASRLRAAALEATAGAREIADFPPLLAIEAEARALTEANLALLPKLMLVACAFERAAAHPLRAARAERGARRLRDFAVRGAAALAVPAVDPDAASGRLAVVLADVRERHGHPVVPSYYCGLANWAALLTRLWSAVRPVVGTRRYRAWRDELVAGAERAWADLDAGSGGARSAPSAEARAVVAAFRTRILPDLLLDVAMLQRLVGAGSAADQVAEWLPRDEAAGATTLRRAHRRQAASVP